MLGLLLFRSGLFTKLVPFLPDFRFGAGLFRDAALGEKIKILVHIVVDFLGLNLNLGEIPSLASLLMSFVAASLFDSMSNRLF